MRAYRVLFYGVKVITVFDFIYGVPSVVSQLYIKLHGFPFEIMIRVCILILTKLN